MGSTAVLSDGNIQLNEGISTLTDMHYRMYCAAAHGGERDAGLRGRRRVGRQRPWISGENAALLFKFSEWGTEQYCKSRTVWDSSE